MLDVKCDRGQVQPISESQFEVLSQCLSLELTVAFDIRLYEGYGRGNNVASTVDGEKLASLIALRQLNLWSWLRLWIT